MDAWRVEVLNAVVQAEVEALPGDIPREARAYRRDDEHDGPAAHARTACKAVARQIVGDAHERQGRRIVILHAFVKKTQKTPPEAIRLALKRAKELPA